METTKKLIVLGWNRTTELIDKANAMFSHPIDPLLPNSRLQGMKALLAKAKEQSDAKRA